MKYNSEQQEAILHQDGPAMILAGPGSGKTLVITERISHLIHSCQIPPSQILVITFTRAAADEMKSRFLKREEESGTSVTFGTFHATFYKIIRLACRLGDGSVITPQKRMEWLREFLLSKTSAASDNPEFLPEVSAEISSVKGQCLDIKTYEASSCEPELFRTVFRFYQNRLAEAGLVDFEDMLVRCYQLLKNDEQLLQYWRDRYRYILVDEFQDINRLQYQIVRLLAAPLNNLFIVGDDDQSIYRFRGSHPEIMLNFPGEYPGCRVVRLTECYRCAPEILAPAGRLIAHNRDRYEKQLKAVQAPGAAPLVLSYETRREQNDALCDRLKRLHALGMNWEQAAILYRTNFHARGMAAALVRQGIPFILREKISSPYEHFIAQDILAYLRLGAGSRARRDFLMILNKPRRYLSRQALMSPEVSWEELREFYRERDYMGPILDRMAYDLKMLGKMQPFAAIQYIRKGMNYEGYLEEYAAEHGRDKQELLELLDELQEDSIGFADLASWKEHMDQVEQELNRIQNTREEKKNGVLLSTLHGAKGLEFDAVFLPDLNEGILPHRRSVAPAELEEERRLLYVGMTRARAFLWLSFLYKPQGGKAVPSRFIRELEK